MHAFLLFILLPVITAASPNEHRVEMLKGIESVPVLGTPGTMAVWGEHSFAVILGKDQSQPIAAASTFGDGRFFAIAHGSYVGGIKDGSADLFMTQVVSWVSQKESPKIGTLTNNTKNWNEVDILLWGQNMQLSSGIEAKLLHWIDQGGGVIASACPWGWAQVTGKNLQTDLSQNRVMAKLGLQYGGNYAKGIGGSFQLKPIHDETNASIALQAIETEGMCTLIGSGAVQYAVQLSPTFRKKVNAVIDADELHGPSKNAPVKSGDVRRRLFVTNFSSDWTSLQVDKVVAASGSDVFPGTVDASFPRVREDLQLDSSVGGWQSTGMYVCPGEKLTINIKSGSSDNWSIRIGCHKDTLWHKGTWTRWPAITHVKKLEQHLEIVTPWGGLVYFESQKGASKLEVVISGIVKAPFFDVTGTSTDWKIERNNPAPWAEIKGHHMILSVPSAAVRNLDNPEDVAKFWDTVVRSHCELAGIEVPSRPERFVADQQISAGYMHS
ncbi:MAG TPA: hypothetical protein EYO40_01205, partial [Phycisphaerales bacterium]|nr:hypothetical protein [Phycisphaerales bacterium]